MSTKVRLEALGSLLPSAIDLFICAASFEARSISIARALPVESVKRAIVFSSLDELGKTATDTANTLDDLFAGGALSVQYDPRNPLDVADRILKSILNSSPSGNVLIDVTAFTHEALLILLRSIQVVNPQGTSLIGLYNSATDYGIGLSKERKWLTKGVSEIRSVLGYSGTLVPTRPQHLIVLAGFELERAEKTINMYEPSLLSIGLGNPQDSISLDLFKINDWFHKQLVERYKNVQQFQFSPDDSNRTKSAILAHIAANPGYNAQIAPMNTKISTIGVALAAMEDASIQVCYADPSIYNVEGYSTPSPDAYVFEIVLPLMQPLIGPY